MIAQSSQSNWFPAEVLIPRKFEIQVGVPRHAKHAGGVPRPRRLEGCPR